MIYPKLTLRGWAQIPEKYIFYAVDADGRINAYRELPFPTDIGRFACSNPDIFRMGQCAPVSDWQNSLQQRPTTTEQPKNTQTPAVTHVRLSMPEFERIAKDFGLNVRHCETYCDAAMYSPAGNVSIIFVADVPVNITVHDAVGDITVTVHDQIASARCKCGGEYLEDHTCPYQQDVNNSDQKCNCCEECTYQCSQDI